jgi:hypothetical protein
MFSPAKHMRRIAQPYNFDVDFFVSLTVRLSITLAIDQFDAQNFNTFIIILYMYMFRAISCSSSVGQILFIQHLVSSLSVKWPSGKQVKREMLSVLS